MYMYVQQVYYIFVVTNTSLSFGILSLLKTNLNALCEKNYLEFQDGDRENFLFTRGYYLAGF